MNATIEMSRTLLGGNTARFAGDLTHDVVVIVDRCMEVRRALSAQLSAEGVFVETFQNTLDFLCTALPDTNCCLLVEAGPGGGEGMEILRLLACQPARPAVVFLTEQGEGIATAMSAMRAGANDVLGKPLLYHCVREAVERGLAAHRVRREQRSSALSTLDRAARLTPRERQVMALVTAGLMNKQVASELKLSEISVKIHRGNLMKKMGVRTLPDLVRAVDLLGRLD